jgi:hypothetical protein
MIIAANVIRKNQLIQEIVKVFVEKHGVDDAHLKVLGLAVRKSHGAI